MPFAPLKQVKILLSPGVFCWLVSFADLQGERTEAARQQARSSTPSQLTL